MFLSRPALVVLAVVVLATGCGGGSKKAAPGPSVSTPVSATLSATSSPLVGGGSAVPSVTPPATSGPAATTGAPVAPAGGGVPPRPSGSPVAVATAGTEVAAPPQPEVFSTAGAEAACQNLVTAPYEVLQCGTVGSRTVVAEQKGDVGDDAQFRVVALHHDTQGWVVDLSRDSQPGELDLMGYLAAEVDASPGLDLLVGARSSGTGGYLSVDVVTGMDATPAVVLHRDLAAGSVTVDGGVMLYDAQYADGAPTADPTSYTQDQVGPGSGARDVSAARVGEPADAPDSQLCPY